MSHVTVLAQHGERQVELAEARNEAIFMERDKVAFEQGRKT